MVDKPKANPNRIPAGESDAWQSWALPSVGKNDSTIKGSSPSSAQGKSGVAAGETIEDIEVEGLTSTGLTAEQMSEIVQAAEQEGFTQGFEQAQQQGYDEGYLQGQERGAEDIRQLLTIEQQTFASLVKALKEPVDQQDEKLEILLLTIVERISRAVVARDLVTQPADIIPLIRQSVAALPTLGNNITLHLNLADHDCVQRYAQEHGHDWKLHVTPDIRAGGVRVSTPESVVDGTVERRLDETIERFIQRQDLDEITSDEQLLEREHPVSKPDLDSAQESTTDATTDPASDFSGDVVNEALTPADAIPADSEPDNTLDTFSSEAKDDLEADDLSTESPEPHNPAVDSHASPEDDQSV